MSPRSKKGGPSNSLSRSSDDSADCVEEVGLVVLVDELPFSSMSDFFRDGLVFAN